MSCGFAFISANKIICLIWYNLRFWNVCVDKIKMWDGMFNIKILYNNSNNQPTSQPASQPHTKNKSRKKQEQMFFFTNKKNIKLLTWTSCIGSATPFSRLLLYLQFCLFFVVVVCIHCIYASWKSWERHFLRANYTIILTQFSSVWLRDQVITFIEWLPWSRD